MGHLRLIMKLLLFCLLPYSLALHAVLEFLLNEFDVKLRAWSLNRQEWGSCG